MKATELNQTFVRENYLEAESVRVWFSRIGTIPKVGKNLYQAHINVEDRDMTFEEDVARALKKVGFEVKCCGHGNGIVVSREGLRATRDEVMVQSL